MTTATPASSLAAISTVRRVKDRTATTLIWLSFGLALIPLIWLLWTVVAKGLHAVTRNGWFTESQRGITYRVPGGGDMRQRADQHDP